MLVVICAAWPLVSCVGPTRHRMLPDGTWQITSDAGGTYSEARAESEFKERVQIICPQGYKVISYSKVRLRGITDGVVARITCDGDKRTVAKDNPQRSTFSRAARLKKAKKCQSKGGVWLDGLCVIDLD